MSQIPTPPSSIIQRLVEALNSRNRMNQGKRFPGANPQGGEQVHPVYDFGSMVKNNQLFPRIQPRNISLHDAISRRLEGKSQVF